MTRAHVFEYKLYQLDTQTFCKPREMSQNKKNLLHVSQQHKNSIDIHTYMACMCNTKHTCVRFCQIKTESCGLKQEAQVEFKSVLTVTIRQVELYLSW